jgi:ornithine--oxo-acid transaminase
MLQNGLIAKPTQKNIIRFSPPLVINDNQIKDALSIVEKSWNSLL